VICVVDLRRLARREHDAQRIADAQPLLTPIVLREIAVEARGAAARAGGRADVGDDLALFTADSFPCGYVGMRRNRVD
jgi:hypothetical protein